MTLPHEVHVHLWARQSGFSKPGGGGYQIEQFRCDSCGHWGHVVAKRITEYSDPQTQVNLENRFQRLKAKKS